MNAFAGWLLILLCCNQAQALTLQKAIELAQKNSHELKEIAFERQSNLAGLDQIDSAFDTTSFAQISIAEQKATAPPTSFQETTLGARKLFGAGIALESKLVHTWKKIDTQLIPIGAQPQINPSKTLSPEISINAHLWRNFLTREIELEKAIARFAVLTPLYMKSIMAQKISFETEQMYWQLAALNRQITISRELVDATKKFASSMRKRMELGRADDVDVADADARTISREASLLELTIAKDQVMKNLAYRINGSPSLAGLNKVRLPDTYPRENKIRPESQATHHAHKYRFDIQLLNKQKDVLGNQVKLSDEKAKPRLNFLMKSVWPGVGEDTSKAVENTGKDADLSFALTLEMELANTGPNAERRKALADRNKLSAEEAKVKREIAAMIAATYTEWQGSKRRLVQKENQIQQLIRKKKAEENKLSQARSDAVVVLRYEMEVLGARLEKVAILKKRHDSAANINYLLHSYPRY